jgi:thiol-disulfide isomerase/thioredoxin
VPQSPTSSTGSSRPGGGGPKRPGDRRGSAQTAIRWGVLGLVVAVVITLVVVYATGAHPFRGSKHVANTLATARWLKTLRIVNAGTAPMWPDLLPKHLQVPDMPTVLYIGADWCPYCAAERWPLVIALSRFGRFERLNTNRSSSSDVFPDTVTWTFYKSRYVSPYIRLVAFETATRQGPTHPLETVTEPYLSVFETLDAPPRVPVGYNGSIPFVLVGGKYLWIGTSYSPALLVGQTWQSLIPSIRTNQIPMGPPINANANALTAAICLADGNRPATVCENPVIRALSRHLQALPPGK